MIITVGPVRTERSRSTAVCIPQYYVSMPCFTEGSTFIVHSDPISTHRVVVQYRQLIPLNQFNLLLLAGILSTVLLQLLLKPKSFGRIDQRL